MKFDKPRVYPRNIRLKNGSKEFYWSVPFDGALQDESRFIENGRDVDGSAFSEAELDQMILDGEAEDFTEVTSPPFDLSKLDCVGVFHLEGKEQEFGYFYDMSDGDFMAMPDTLKPAGGSWIECLRPDIANATIAELRRRVKELELQALTNRPLYSRRMLITELRRQCQAAWMRGDLNTADRIADLIGDKRPSDHEAADSQGAAV